jgi:hypothetical protein
VSFFLHRGDGAGRGAAREWDALLAVGLASSLLAAGGLSIAARLRQGVPAPMVAWWFTVALLAGANALSWRRRRSRAAAGAAARALSAALAVACLASPLGAAAGEARLDAHRRRLTCSGVGAPRLRESVGNPTVARAAAERAARRDARRACLAAVAALPLAGGGTAGERMQRDPALAREVEGVARKAKVAGVPRYFADGGVALELALPLDGALGRLLPLELAAPPAPGDEPPGPP